MSAASGDALRLRGGSRMAGFCPGASPSASGSTDRRAHVRAVIADLREQDDCHGAARRVRRIRPRSTDAARDRPGSLSPASGTRLSAAAVSGDGRVTMEQWRRRGDRAACATRAAGGAT